MNADKKNMKFRKLFVNCDGVLSCIAPFSEDITREKCFEGKGECEFRKLP